MKNILLIILLLPLLNYAQVKTDTNISVISSERYSVLYRGITNPIKIAVPGAKSFTASAPGLTKIDSIGNYDYNVTTTSGTTAIINIEAIMQDNTVIKEFKTFEIRDITGPLGLINGQNCYNCIVLLTKEELRNAVITVSLNDPSFDSRQIVKSFEIYIPKVPGIIIEGNTINEKASKYIDKLKPGDKVIISNIKHLFLGESLLMKSPSPIIIQIEKER